MIGGQDIVIPTTAGPAALDFAVRATAQLWPDAVFEDAQTGADFPDGYASIPFGKCREILAYRDKTSAGKWSELGADESLDGTMLHLLVSQKSLTLVCDANPSRKIKSLIKAIIYAIQNNILISQPKIAA
jgi:hypothetical protein